jgi:hypothetical protein
MKKITRLIMATLLVSAASFASGGNPAPKSAGKGNVKKAVDPVCEASAVPFYENFESAPIGGLPDCTTAIYPDNGNAWETINGPGNGFDSITLVGTGSTTDPSDKWFFTAGVQLEAGTFYKISYKYGNKDETTSEKLKVAFGTSADVASMTSTIATYNDVTGGEPQYATNIPFMVPASGVYYFGFNMFSDANQWSLLVDDIAVETLECGVPQNLTVTGTTASTATFSWEAPENSDTIQMYQYCIVTDNSPVEGPTTSTFAGSSYYDLAPSTTYNVYVRAFCSGAWSDWSVPASFTTEACGVYSVPYVQDFESVAVPAIPSCTSIENTGEGSDWITASNPGNGFESKALQYTANSSDAAAWFYTPGIALEAGTMYQITYRYGNNSDTTTESFEVKNGTSPDSEAMAAGSSLGNYPLFTGGTPQSIEIGPFSPATSGTYYFGFHASSPASAGNIYVDDIHIEAFTCSVPLNVAVTDVTTTTATISWESAGGNTAQVYQYAVTTTDEAPADGVYSPNFSNPVDGLTPNTTYYVFVRSSCSAVWSDWSEVVTFTTAELGLAQNHFAGLKVSPNPSKDRITISNSDIIQKVEIYNLVGQIVIGSNYDSLSTEVNVSGLSAGSYFLTVYSGGSSSTVRLLKE